MKLYEKEGMCVTNMIRTIGTEKNSLVKTTLDVQLKRWDVK